MKSSLSILLTASLIVVTKMSFAECTEYKIIEYADRTEAICVGEPSKEVDKKSLDKQKAKEKQEALKAGVEYCYNKLKNYKNFPDYKDEEARCRRLESDRRIEQAVYQMQPKSDGTTPVSRRSKSLGAIQGEMTNQKAQLDAQSAAQQAEIQRQNAEMQRMQQQQRFNDIWKK